MEPRQLYKTMTFNKDFGFKQYITPAYECDPKRQILARTYEDYKNKPRQGKLKITAKHKKCYFDEIVQLVADNPEPSKYKVQGNMAKKFKSASLKKINLKSTKLTYIDSIQRFQAKHKPPGVGKFDLTKFTDFGTKRYSSARLDRQKQIIKHNNFDDGIKVAAELPCPGQYNPHLQVKKVKLDRTDMKFWKQKHEQLQKKRAKTVETKRGPNTYEPIVANTFHSLKALNKVDRSRWSHGQIDIRKGLRSQMKQPSPCQYNTVHQWMKSGKKQVPIGNFSVLNRITSAGHFSVYH